jgi:hypothetical protein
MSEVQRHESNEITPLNRIKYESPFFVIEIAGEPRNPQLMGVMSVMGAVPLSPCLPTPHSLFPLFPSSSPAKGAYNPPVLESSDNHIALLSTIH